MTLPEVQAAVVALTEDERRNLAAFLTTLRMKETGEWAQATRPEPADRHGWVSLEEAKRRLLGEG
jgi:DNA primase catalytic subunit